MASDLVTSIGIQSFIVDAVLVFDGYLVATIRDCAITSPDLDIVVNLPSSVFDGNLVVIDSTIILIGRTDVLIDGCGWNRYTGAASDESVVEYWAAKPRESALALVNGINCGPKH